MVKIFTVLLIITFNTIQAKELDPEIYESLKCIKMFPYFERKYKIPLDTLHSISLRESGKAHSKHNIRIVWPWAVNVEGEGYYFSTRTEAVLFVKKQLLSGKENIDIGCMQINLKHHPDAFRTLEQAFDPTINVDYGAWFLRSKYDQLGNWGKAIAHYHSATHELGFSYKQDVIKIIRNMQDYKNSFKNYAYLQTELLNKSNTMPMPTNNFSYSHNKTSPYLKNKDKRYKSSLMVPVYRLKNDTSKPQKHK